VQLGLSQEQRIAQSVCDLQSALAHLQGCVQLSYRPKVVAPEAGHHAESSLISELVSNRFRLVELLANLGDLPERPECVAEIQSEAERLLQRLRGLR
jgi:hypothetical protein